MSCISKSLKILRLVNGFEDQRKITVVLKLRSVEADLLAGFHGLAKHVVFLGPPPFANGEH